MFSNVTVWASDPSFLIKTERHVDTTLLRVISYFVFASTRRSVSLKGHVDHTADGVSHARALR